MSNAERRAERAGSRRPWLRRPPRRLRSFAASAATRDGDPGRANGGGLPGETPIPIRYPHLRVSTRSRNPLALLAAAREELRLARVEPAEIQLFTAECMAADDDWLKVRRVVDRWIGHVAV